MNFKETKSIFLQIADRIMDEILLGNYPEEERIPSVRAYAALVEVNANTVVRTYEYLQNLEIIYNKRGIGYFVSQGARQIIISLRKDLFIHEVLPDVFQQMNLLDFTPDDMLKRYQQFLDERAQADE